MSRDHTKLRVFHDAHNLTLVIYRETKNFPKDEWFGLRLQMRRAAASTSTNIVEGNARKTTKDYCNFLNIALASAAELSYLVTLSTDLGLIAMPAGEKLGKDSAGVVRQMQALVDRMERLQAAERAGQKR
jgi:four helix bundle protein